MYIKCWWCFIYNGSRMFGFLWVYEKNFNYKGFWFVLLDVPKALVLRVFCSQIGIALIIIFLKNCELICSTRFPFVYFHKVWNQLQSDYYFKLKKVQISILEQQKIQLTNSVSQEKEKVRDYERLEENKDSSEKVLIKENKRLQAHLHELELILENVNCEVRSIAAQTEFSFIKNRKSQLHIV